jgi:CRISPR-associated protein Cst1
MVEEKKADNIVRLYPSDWRWSAAIVGLDKFFKFLKNKKNIHFNYYKAEDYIEFNESDISIERYLLFAEDYFSDLMHHKIVEDLVQITEPSGEQIKLANEKLSKNTSSNTVMIKTFKGIKYDGKNSNTIIDIINANRFELIEQTFKGGRALYYNFCNESSMFSEKGKSCRIRGYYVDMGKKSKSVSYMRNKLSFVYQDSKYFDFIPFAFSKTREAFFVNNNFSIEQLINTNKDNLINNDKTARSQLLFKTMDSASFIHYDVEVIKKERERDFFETIFIRKKSINILEKINKEIVSILSRPCNIKESEKSQDIWINIERIVTDSILNFLKLDELIENLFKAYYDYNFLISHLIKINQYVYQLVFEGGDEMTGNQKKVYGAAMEIKQILKGKENKLRAYEQRLISSLTLKDYSKVQELLLHLSAFSQVRMDFLLDIFEDFEKNKNLVYTFINVLGEKKKVNIEKGENKI